MAETALTRRNPARWLVVIIPYIWLALFFLAPFLIIVKISLSDQAIAMPPYTPVFEGLSKISDFFSQLDFENYTFLTEDERWLLAHGTASETDKARHYGGEAAYAGIRQGLAARRRLLEQSIFPETDVHWVSGRTPDGEPYEELTGHAIEAEQRDLEREQVYEILLALAREDWRPY